MEIVKKIDTTLLVADSLTIIPYEVSIFNISRNKNLLSNEFFIFNNKIFIQDSIFKSMKNDSILIRYRTLNLNLGKKTFHLDTNSLKKAEKAILIGLDPKNRNENKSGYLPGNIDYDGSFARGLSVGNKQDLSLTSDFNLQMSGNIGGGMILKAAISDANIPFQPEGTSQRLNEFDKVFIEISKDKHSLIAGDFEVSNPDSHFSKYFKKLKGVSYSGIVTVYKNINLHNNISFAISKGKFNRINLKTVNGNQGPYKLTANTGDKYLIILAGTEKIFLDGKLLARGQENDYTIDYNSSELIFTSKVMITENSRVVAEFEFSDQNYLRSLSAINTSIGDSTRNIYFNFYNEQDSKSSLSLIELDSTDIDILKKTGDNPDKIFVSGIKAIDKSDIQNEKIYYVKKHLPELNDSILIYNPNIETATCTAIFTYLGENQGSYAIDNSVVANGRVYKWVGVGNGSYNPVVQLVAPEQKQLVSIGSNISLSKNRRIKSEFSISKLDKNRYSDINNQNNSGYAGFFEYRKKNQIKILKTNLNFENISLYEFSNKDFKPLNPYRSTEFNRDWNVKQNDKTYDEHYFSNKCDLTNDKFIFNYTISGFLQDQFFSGIKNDLALNFSYKGLGISAMESFMSSHDDTNQTRFSRPKFDISQKIKFLNNTKIGFNYENESNIVKILNSNTLQKTSFSYDKYRFYLNFQNSSKANINFYSSLRKDYLPVQESLSQYTQSIESGISGEMNSAKISRLQFNIAYRNLAVINENLGSNRPESNIIGKINHSLKLFNSGISSISNMDLSTGQQAKADYVFVKVNPGTGTHIWNDSNKDGIEGKDEFIVIQGIDTANYVKLIQYSNEYIRANSTVFNNNFRIEMKNIIKNKNTDLKKTISKFSFNSIYRINQKTASGEIESLFPFFKKTPDTLILQSNINHISTLYFNQGDPQYDFHIGYKRNNDRLSQVGGFTKNSNQESFFYGRFKIIKGLDYQTTISKGTKTFETTLNSLNNYNYSYFSYGHEITFYPKNSFNLKLNYYFSKKKNDSELKETAFTNSIKVSSRNNFKNNIRLESSFNLVMIKYTGTGNNYLELTMLEGLRNGNNFLWNIRFVRRLKSNLDIIVQYDGRKTGTSPVIHSAKMQAKATF